MAIKDVEFDILLKSTDRQFQFQRDVVFTNDRNSVRVIFNIKDMTASELSGATAQVLLYMRDGSFYQIPNSDVTKDGTSFKYVLKGNEGKHRGVVKAQLVVMFTGGSELASRKCEFEIDTGLDNVVATEVMIQDWTTLTREAREFIAEMKENETQRQVDFDNAQTSWQSTFNDNESNRQSVFELNEQTRQESEVQRQQLFEANELTRENTFDSNEANRNNQFESNENDRQQKESDRQSSESYRVNAENQRESNETGRISAESERVSAESGRAEAENERSGFYDGFNTALAKLERDKANRKQEEWITPTLLNGWYAIRPDEPPQYMKDDFGFVHFRGYIAKSPEATSNVPFNIPSSYRPNIRTGFNLSNIAASGFRSLAVDVFSTNGNVDFAGALNGAMSWYVLSTISYKAVS